MRAPRSDLLGYAGGVLVASVGFALPLLVDAVGHLAGARQGVVGSVLYGAVVWLVVLGLARLAEPLVTAGVSLTAMAVAVHVAHTGAFAQDPVAGVVTGEGYRAALPGLLVLAFVHLFATLFGLWSAHQYRPHEGGVRGLLRDFRLAAQLVLGVQLIAVASFFAIELLPAGKETQQGALVGVVMIGTALLATRAAGWRLGVLVAAFLSGFLAHVAIWAEPDRAGGSLAGWVAFDLVFLLVVATLAFAALAVVRIFLGVRPPAARSVPRDAGRAAEDGPPRGP